MKRPKGMPLQAFYRFCGGLHQDAPDFGPTPLRSIEWLFIPCRAKIGYRLQDVDAAVAKLQALGRFPIEVDGRGLKVLGYLPSAPGFTLRGEACA